LHNNLPITDEQLSRLSKYVELLLAWNKKINLISRKDEQNIWEHHILHSTSFLFRHRFKSRAAVLDLGTGGGLPGIPLKILCPDLLLTLLDSTQKKVNAVAEITQKLGLDNTHAVWGRAEDVAKSSKFQGIFDYVLARAVAPLDKLVTWAKPFLKAKTGPNESANEKTLGTPSLIAWKGGDITREIEKTKRLGVENLSVINLDFKGSEHLIESEKRLILVSFST
jgi:16S rRNA (guanine527-N7)-methyltransferase